MTTSTKMTGVTEYCEEYDVELTTTRGLYEFGVSDNNRKGRGRLVIRALNEGGFNSTEVDVLQLVQWLKANRPELLQE